MQLISPISRPGAGPRIRRIAAITASALFAATSLATVPATASTRHGNAINHQHRNRHAHAAQSGCADAGTPTVSASPKVMRNAVVCLINQQRADHGLPALRAARRLDLSAQNWTNTLVATQSFTHGSDFSTRITAVGFSWQSAGENIATGYPTPKAVVSAWMASPDHCKNILNPTYSSVGTGMSHGHVSGFASGPATWTQDFALPTGARAPSGNWGPSRNCV